MKKFLGLTALCLAALSAASLFSCSNSSDNSALLAALTTQGGTTTTIGKNGQSDNPNFLTNWETMEDLYINDSGKLNTKVAAPWNSRVSATLLPDTVRYDVKKEEGWDVAFDFLNQDDLKDMNYFGLYNKYTGVLRIFYYFNKEVSQSASDFAFEVVLGSDGAPNKSYYAALNYGIPMDAEVDMNQNLLGDSGSAKTFRFLVTPYSGIGRNVMTRGWYAFDIDLSSYTGKSLSEQRASIQITCRANNKTNVTLATDILGKIGGDINAKIDRAKLSASSNGIGGTLADVGSAIGGVSKAVASTIQACLGGGILGIVKSVGLWASTACNIASKAVKGGGGGSGEDPQDKLSGQMDLKLNATANTTGYLESAVATNVEPFTMTNAAINKGSNVGKGVWNIDKSPELYFVSDRVVIGSEDPGYWSEIMEIVPTSVYDMEEAARFPYFYDPSSFEVAINKEIFPDAADIKALSFCGIYKNNGNKTQNTAFRAAVGLDDLKTDGLDLPETYSIQDLGDGTVGKSWTWIMHAPDGFYTLSTQDQYKAAAIQFNDLEKALEWKSYGNETDLHYYGQELSMDGSDSGLNFIVEPQIYYALFNPDKNKDEYKKPSRLPELYVVVIVQFESGGKIFNYSRTYLPKVKKVKFAEAKTIIGDIKTRLAAQTDKIYKDEYITSLDKKLQFWGASD